MKKIILLIVLLILSINSAHANDSTWKWTQTYKVTSPENGATGRIFYNPGELLKYNDITVALLFSSVLIEEGLYDHSAGPLLGLSSNDGKTWKAMNKIPFNSGADMTIYGLAPILKENFFMAINEFATSGTLFFISDLDNGNGEPKELDTIRIDKSVKAYDFVNRNTGAFITANRPNTVYTTFDGLQTFEAVFYDSLYTLVSVNVLSNDVIKVLAYSKDTNDAGEREIVFFLTEDGGKTWGKYILEKKTHGSFRISTKPYFLDAATGFISYMDWTTDSKTAWIGKTEDGGKTWKYTDINEVKGISMPPVYSFSDKIHGIAYDDKWISFTNDGGNTWDTKSITDLSFVFPTDCESYPLETRIIQMSPTKMFIAYGCYIYVGEKSSGINEPTAIANSLLTPNPASDNCTLSFELERSSYINISVVDMLGREIMNIFNGYSDIGTFSQKFDTKKLSNGTYSIIINTGDNIKVEKLMVNR